MELSLREALLRAAPSKVIIARPTMIRSQNHPRFRKTLSG
jgi:hypothetical protein